jgi:hypothetical protein
MKFWVLVWNEGDEPCWTVQRKRFPTDEEEYEEAKLEKQRCEWKLQQVKDAMERY